MKILRIVYDWPPPWKGLAPGPYDLSAAQQKIGEEVTVFCGGWPRRRKEKPDGVRVVRLPSGLIPGLNLSVFLTTAPAVVLYYLVYRLRRRVDVVHIHGHLSLFFSVYKLLFGRLDKTSYVLHFHHVIAARRAQWIQGGGALTLPTRIEWRLSELADRLGVRAASRIIAVSDSAYRELMKFYAVQREKLEVVQNGVNTTIFTPGGPIAKLPWETKEKKVLFFVGTLGQHKNPDLLIKALPELPEKYVVVLVGVGPLFGPLSQLARELKVEDRVEFKGYIANRDLPSYFRAANLFILPSNYENFPKVVLEALACGVPVIASGFDPGPDFAEMIVPLGELNSRVLAKTILEQEKNPLQVDVGWFGAQYSWQTRAQKLHQIYLETIQSRKDV